MATRRPLPARTRLLVPVLGVLILLLVLLAVFTRLYTDLLFFRSVGFSKVFTTVLVTRIVLFVLFGAAMATAVGTNIVLAYRVRPPVRPMSLEQQNLERYRVAIEPYIVPILLLVTSLFGIVAGLSASGRWRVWLQWVNRVSFGQKDPQFHRDLSYYMFTLPFYRFLLGFLFTAVVLSLVVAVVTHYLFGGIRIQTQAERVVPAAKVHLSVLLGILALLKAWAYYLDRFGIVFSSRGVVTGASYTDIHAVLPAKLILLFISLLCAVLFIYNIFQRGWTLPALGAGILILSALVIGGIYPAFVQQFQVRPNEVNRESPYIARNITATRDAYGIAGITLTQYPAETTANQQAIDSDHGTIPNARLLDPNILSPTYKALQQFRGYFNFPQSLDIDRYTVNGTTGDYVVSVRELDQSGLNSDQRNWINLHLAYTHGLGIVAAPANVVDGSGQPTFAEGDLPPNNGDLGVKESRVYFGELSPNYSIVGTSQPEVDGPAQNGSQQTTTYTGKGGVSIGSTFRKALFALRFQEKNILLSGSVKSNSRILYIRNPRDRVKKVAPWLTLDGDPYPAVVDGRVTWIIDGYTTSDGYPYSERKTLGSVTSDADTNRASNRSRQPSDQVNYIRNSVKATVDAYDGTVTLYAWDPSDPVLRTWMKAFPGTVQPKSKISADLMKHIRYPEDLFKVQRDLIGSYHVTDPKAFYSKEDFWTVSPSPEDTSQAQPPFYVYSQLYQRSGPSFNLTSPLISRRAPKLAAYMAVSSDPGNYGQFQLLQLPEGTTISGPVQVQGQIESNNDVANKLNPLRLAGSKIIPGNLLTLPVANGLLYVEPYYVTKIGTGYPTMQDVAVVFGQKVGFAPSLSDALKQVFGTSGNASTSGPSAPSVPTPPTTGGGTGNSAEINRQIAAADNAYSDAQAALKKTPPDFAAYGEAQKRLSDALNALSKLASATPAPSPSPSPSAGAKATPSASPKAGAGGGPTVSPTPSPAR